MLFARLSRARLEWREVKAKLRKVWDVFCADEGALQFGHLQRFATAWPEGAR